MHGGCENGGLVRLSAEIDSEGGAFERIRNPHGKVAGIAVVAVGHGDGEADGVIPEDFRIPDALVYGIGAAVELVFVFVGREHIVFAVECEGSTADTVGIAAHCFAEEAVAGKGRSRIVIADGAVLPLVLQGNNGGTERNDGNFQLSV